MLLTGLSENLSILPKVVRSAARRVTILSRFKTFIHVIGSVHDACRVEGEKENELELLKSMEEKIQAHKHMFLCREPEDS